MLNKNVLEYKDFGFIKFKLDQIMKEREITVYELSSKANVGFQTIKKLKEGEDLTRINLDVLAKLCYVLECEISDLLEYKKQNLLLSSKR